MKKDLMKRNSYYYDLPEKLIAQYPLQKRDNSRLLYLSKDTGRIEHHNFGELPNLIRGNDILVINKTKVIPARLFGKRDTAAQIWTSVMTSFKVVTEIT